MQAAVDVLMDRALNWDEGGCTIDIVIVSAGRGLAGGILNSDESQWEEVYRVNVLGAAHLMCVEPGNIWLNGRVETL